MHDRGILKNLQGLVPNPNIHIVFSHFCFACIYFVRILAKMARAPCHWCGSIHAVNISLSCFNLYALKVLICINRGIVHQKNVQFFM